MTPVPLACRKVLAAGTSALIGVAVLTGCAAKEKPAETPAPTSPSATAPASPTEKSVPGAITPGPQSGSGPQHSITPTPRPAPTALPGNAITGG